MSTTLITLLGHAFLPLAVKVRQSAATPEHFSVEAFIDGECIDGREASNETAARFYADNMFSMWVLRLTPAFDAGFALGQQQRRSA